MNDLQNPPDRWKNLLWTFMEGVLAASSPWFLASIGLEPGEAVRWIMGIAIAGLRRRTEGLRGALAFFSPIVLATLIDEGLMLGTFLSCLMLTAIWLMDIVDKRFFVRKKQTQ